MIEICYKGLVENALAVFYVILGTRCTYHLYEHKAIFFNRNSGLNSLGWYLFCTLFLCSCRSVDFALISFLTDNCREKENTSQWEINGENKSRIINFFLIFLSTSPYGLFFTSYTSFAISLTKVVDLLTDIECLQSSTLKVILITLNLCIWASLLSLWVGTFWGFESLAILSRASQLALISSAFVTCFLFTFYCCRSLAYLITGAEHKLDPRYIQLQKLLKLKRVITVCVVCTLCFSVRAVLLLLKIHFSRYMSALYFFLSEVFPTAVMLLAFRSSHGDTDVPSSSPIKEYKQEYGQLVSRYSPSSNVNVNNVAYSSNFSQPSTLLVDPSRPWFVYDNILNVKSTNTSGGKGSGSSSKGGDSYDSSIEYCTETSRLLSYDGSNSVYMNPM